MLNRINYTKLENHKVSTVEIWGGIYETMVFDKVDEIQQLRTKDLNEAKKNHIAMVKKYTTSTEIKKLAELLILADEKAQDFANIDDGGTCNFDTAVLDLKGKRKDFIEKLEAVSGFHLSKLDGKFWGGCYFVSFNLKGQANRRTKMAESIGKFLKDAGVNVRMYYQAD